MALSSVLSFCISRLSHNLSTSAVEETNPFPAMARAQVKADFPACATVCWPLYVTMFNNRIIPGVSQLGGLNY